MKQSILSEHGFEGLGLDVKREAGPLKSLCVSCGKQKMLNWIVDSKYVCGQCKDFLVKRSK